MKKNVIGYYPFVGRITFPDVANRASRGKEICAMAGGQELVRPDFLALISWRSGASIQGFSSGSPRFR